MIAPLRCPLVRLRCRALAGTSVVALLLCCSRIVGAQDWQPPVLTTLDGRLSFGGELTATVGGEDDAYFTYADYEHSTVSLLRLGLVSTWRPTDWLSFLVELRAEGDSRDGQWVGSPYAAYVRLKPWRARPVELRVGRVPTAFGAFPRQLYGGNLLIGYPLAYQYLTTLRSDAIPATSDELLGMRGRGWLTQYSLGSASFRQGVPLVSAFRYDTGLLTQIGSNSSRAQVLASVTTGTLSNPRVRDDNGSPQLATRLVVRPLVGLSIGGSFARGDFLADSLTSQLMPAIASRRWTQRAIGGDAEYSRDYWLVRTELVASRWHLPPVASPAIDVPLDATAWMIEGRYKLMPGLYAAARWDHLWFSRLHGDGRSDTWDANVHRTELGVGYTLFRSVTLKASVQRNTRDTARFNRATLGALQVVTWF
jgi:hypothetical protein